MNERVKYNREDIDGLDSSVVNQVHQVALRTGYSKTVTVFDDAGPDRGVERTRQDYMLASFGVAVLRKAVQRIEFYEFSNLRKFLPRLDSIHEFLTSDKYLGRVKVEVSGLPNEITSLTPSGLSAPTVSTRRVPSTCRMALSLKSAYSEMSVAPTTAGSSASRNSQRA